MRRALLRTILEEAQRQLDRPWNANQGLPTEKKD
jgi:hypothetical protein